MADATRMEVVPHAPTTTAIIRPLQLMVLELYLLPVYAPSTTTIGTPERPCSSSDRSPGHASRPYVLRYQ